MPINEKQRKALLKSRQRRLQRPSPTASAVRPFTLPAKPVPAIGYESQSNPASRLSRR